MGEKEERMSTVNGPHRSQIFLKRLFTRNSFMGNFRLFFVVIVGIMFSSSASILEGMASTCPNAPHLETSQGGLRYGFPQHIEKNGLSFASHNVPINRADVRKRILQEINYLLLDRRSRVLLWLTRADSFRPIIVPILRNYKLPAEFIYLAAIESSFSGRALSSAGAFGYWQFIKSTAQQGPIGCNEYDWKMNITNWKDERADLINSTHSASRYLAWMNRIKKVTLGEKDERDGFNDWLLTAAAYNAGPSRVTQRMISFGASSYWDIPLPKETEQYVPRWIALGIISNNREFYGVQVPPRGTASFDTLDKVVLAKDLPFAAMARLLGTTPRVVWELNTRIPSDKAIFPARFGRSPISHTIHVPKGTGKKFIAQLAAQGYTKKK